MKSVLNRSSDSTSQDGAVIRDVQTASHIEHLGKTVYLMSDSGNWEGLVFPKAVCGDIWAYMLAAWSLCLNFLPSIML